jgi:hypothetical protein
MHGSKSKIVFFFGLEQRTWWVPGNNNKKGTQPVRITEFMSAEDPEVMKALTCAGFNVKSKQTIVAKCLIKDGKITRVSYLPCLINKQAQPEILKHDERGTEIFHHMEKITRAAGLNGNFKWEGNEVLVVDG